VISNFSAKVQGKAACCSRMCAAPPATAADASASIDVRPAVPLLSAEKNLRGIQLEPFLKKPDQPSPIAVCSTSTLT
jgi:AsmA protein